jgi:hypothetical protein
MGSTGIKVLLVGENSRFSFQLPEWLDDRSCQCYFAGSCHEACKFISQTAFDLVISQYELPDRTAYPLLGRLMGSTATLFFSISVENGYLWLPMLVRGKEWEGGYGLRPGEFMATLGNALAHSARQETPEACKACS